MRFLRDFSFSHSPASVVEACGRVCMYVCVSLSCVSVVCLNLAFPPPPLHRLPPAPPLPRYEAFAGYFTPQSRKSRTIANLDTCSCTHLRGARAFAYTHAHGAGPFLFLVGGHGAGVLSVFFFQDGLFFLFFFFFFITTSPPSCVAASGRACQFRSR